MRFLLCLGIKPQVCPPQRPDKNAFVERFHFSLEYEALQIDRPGDAAQTVDCVDRFRQHYNHQRPNQARSCNNRPPCMAFTQLAQLPRLPERVDPDIWITSIDGKVFKRRVMHNGSIKVNKHRYYINQKLKGQYVLGKVNASERMMTVTHLGNVVKQRQLQGLHDTVLEFQDYLRLICQEAVSEERQRKRWIDTPLPSDSGAGFVMKSAELASAPPCSNYPPYPAALPG